MVNQSPPIDRRTALVVAQQVQDLLKLYAPAWDQPFDPRTREPKSVSAALIGIFARYAEIIIQRLNQAPDKNFLAFLDLLGATRLPPQPARVPLTFSLAAGSAVDAIVPAGTQVAAPPAEGEKEPVIFETERELVVTAAQLASLYVRDPSQDLYADLGALTTAAGPDAPIFQGNRSLEHILYLGHDLLLGMPQIHNVSLTFNLQPALGDSAQVEWQFWNGRDWQTIQVDAGASLSLAQPGMITLDLGAIAPIPVNTLTTFSNRWLRCRLRTPITPAGEPRRGMVRASQLPQVKQIHMSVLLRRPLTAGLLPELAFANSTPVEMGKDFFPFGEKPKLNDTLYLASTEAFSKDRMQNLAASGATVWLDVQVANPHLQEAASVHPSEDLQLAWECWNGVTWQRVGISQTPSWLSLLELEPLPPVTTERSVVVQGTAPRGASVVGESQGRPQTARVGEDGRFAVSLPLSLGLNIIPFTAQRKNRTGKAWAVTFMEGPEVKQTVQIVVKAPDEPVQKQRIDLAVEVTGETAGQVKQIRVTNSSTGQSSIGAPNTRLAVELAEGRNVLLVEGMTGSGPNDRTVAATTLTVGRVAAPPAPDPGGFADGTYAFCQSGQVTLHLPDTVAPTAVNGQTNYWLRVRVMKGDYGKDAIYKIKDPTKPEEGFTLVLATFRPPIIAVVTIGYEQTLTAAPELCLTYNNLTFSDVTQINKTGAQPFLPFRPAPDTQPTAYVGFTLPPTRLALPGAPWARTISLFGRVADFKYGEILAPLWPGQSKKKAEPGAAVHHLFVLTNPGSVSVTFTLAVFGTQWSATVMDQVTLAAGATQTVAVQVNIPAEALDGSHDQGFLRLTSSTDPALVYTATLATFVSPEFPASERLQLAWEYWNGSGWSRLTVRDGTENFTQPGPVEFLPPADFMAHTEFGLTRYWLRVRWAGGEYAILPRLRRVLLNTTLATQTVTIRNETLGSSDGSESLRFRATRTPILQGQHVLVREPELPAPEEQLLLKHAEGEDAIVITRDAAGRPQEIWIRWHETPDFYGSGARDRHYVLDHLTGEIQFGDGLNGLIPPIGVNNIRLARYQTGGGIKGNKPAGALVQLKTTVPYVDKVTNTEAAYGGADAETLDSLITRAPRTVRHRSRAVTVEDYEDLARLASPAVTRTLCVPQRNLLLDPFDRQPAIPGAVSVVIVPETKEAKPVPSLELLNRVQRYLTTNAAALVDIAVVGPLYVSVNVNAEIALTSLEGASAIEQAVYQTLAAFLHPLTGGLDGAGWAFGREPYKSDFYALLEAIPGVDHIRTLAVVDIEDQPGAKQTGRFLVYSGVHDINLVYTQ